MDFMRENLFQEKFEFYSRETLIHVGRWGITGTIFQDPLFLVQILLLVIATQLLCAGAAVIAYYGIVKPETSHKQRRDSIPCVLLGYGFLVPLLLCTPYWIIRTLDVRNCLLLLNMVGSPVLAAVRLNETLFARNIPDFARHNVALFTLYFAVPIILDHNNVKPVPSTKLQLIQKTGKVMTLFLQATFFLSLLSAHDYKIFPSRPVSNWLDSNLLFWGNLANNLMAASVVSVTLDLGCTFGEVVLSVFTGGLHFTKSHDHPITAATSVSNFWGQRWNRVVSESLKRGVYGPLRRIMPRAPAAISTFLMSGCAHEYMLFVLSSARGPAVVANNLLRQPYQHKIGHQFAFFLWNGLLLILEEFWRDHWSQNLVKQFIPRQIRTMLIMLLVLPITHLFTDEYDQCGIFRDIETAFPQIRLIPNATPLLSHPILDDIVEQNWTWDWFEENSDNNAATIPWSILKASNPHVMDATMEMVES